MQKPEDCQMSTGVPDADDHGSELPGKALNGERWREENRRAIDSSNAWVEKYGLPLDVYRRF